MNPQQNNPNMMTPTGQVPQVQPQMGVPGQVNMDMRGQAQVASGQPQVMMPMQPQMAQPQVVMPVQMQGQNTSAANLGGDSCGGK